MPLNFTYQKGRLPGPVPLVLLDGVAAPASEDVDAVPIPCSHAFWIEGDAAQSITAEVELSAVFPGGGKKWLATISLSGTGAGAGEQCTGSSASYTVPVATSYGTYRHELTSIGGAGAKLHSCVDA